MNNRTIDPATIYQIFYLASQETPLTEISRVVGVSRNCVRWHLEGRYKHKYPERTARRIALLKTPELERVHVPHPWIRMSDASYFFPSRPATRTILSQPSFYGLKRVWHNGTIVTKRAWIVKFLESSMDMPRGLCLTHDACVRLGIPAKLTRQRWVSAMDIPGLPEVPAEVIHRMLEVIDWTGLPFVSLAASDLYGLALSRPQTPFKHENAMFKFLGEASPSKLWIAQPCERR